MAVVVDLRKDGAKMRDPETLSLATALEHPNLITQHDKHETVNVRMTWDDLRIICEFARALHRQGKEK